MPEYSTERTHEYYRELQKRRDVYRKKLIAKGIHPKSNKMLELMCRKFP